MRCRASSRPGSRPFSGRCATTVLRWGLPEGQDAASLMAAGLCRLRPGLLRTAFKQLFSARKPDWERFDGIFDAFWLGKRVRSRSIATGSAKAANNPSLKSLPNSQAERRTGGDTAMDQIPSADEAPGERAGEGRMEGASRADNLAEIDFRKLADPARSSRPMPPRRGSPKRCARG